MITKVENIMAKADIAHNEQFSFFATMFSKSCLLQGHQNASVGGKVLMV